MDIATIIAGPEVSAAIDWWAQMLGRGTADIGNDTLAGAVSAYQATRPPTGDERDRFRESLRGALAARWRDMEENGGFPWDARRPETGGSLRTLSVDYRPDATLTAAVLGAGYPLSATVLPIKTTMWINPGWVVVRNGYRTDHTVIHPAL